MIGDRVKKGARRSGPRASVVPCPRSITSKPPMPLPITTPTRGALAASIRSPLCSIAISVAAIANCTKRAHFFTSLRSIQTSGSNPGTSPAKRVECREASNAVIGPIPDRPETTPAHVAAVPTPSGDTSPIPVTTTRLRIQPLGTGVNLHRPESEQEDRRSGEQAIFPPDLLSSCSTTAWLHPVWLTRHAWRSTYSEALKPEAPPAFERAALP